MCRERGRGSSSSDPELAKRGSIEVTARLVEIPEGAIFERELYNYATVLKYEVLEVHRGKVKGQTIYVGHYNPFKPRSEAADRRVPDVGGNLKSFRAGQVHRMALEESMLDHFTGGILNKYSEEDTDPIYWAVWTESGQRLTGRARDKPCQHVPLAVTSAWLTMVFTTYLFVFYFLPLVLVFYYALDDLSRQAGASDGRTCLVLNTFLVLASYIFYGWWNPWFIFLMLGITVVNYVCGRIIGLPRISRRLRYLGRDVSPSS